MKHHEDFILRDWQIPDAQSLASNANEITIWNNLRDFFPHPYTISDAKEFIDTVISKPKPAVDLAIDINGDAVGGLGLVLHKDVERISAEIGYWLGEKYWGKGIMTQAVRQMVEYSFSNLPLHKLYATVFDFNTTSQKVLINAGFKLEGILSQAAIKNDKIIDLYYYGLIK